MKAIFLDRDGVINQEPGGTEYVKSWSEFQFLPSVRQALKKLSDCGYGLFVISNQAGVAKGLFSQKELDRITANMLKELADYRVSVSGVYYCTHRSEDNCCCRKPKTGLIQTAISDAKKKNCDIEIPSSFFIGDTLRDIQAGKSAGLKTILVFSGKEKPQNKDNWKVLPDFTAADLPEAARIITGQ